MREEGYLFKDRPHLLFQQAANRPASDPPARAADRDLSSGRPRRAWMRRIPRPTVGSPVRLLLQTRFRSLLACAFGQDGACIIAASGDGHIGLWDAATGEEVASKRLGVKVTAGVLAPGDGLLAVATAGGTVHLLDPQTFEVRETVTGNDTGITALAFSPEGRRLACADESGKLRLRDLGSGRDLWIDAHHRIGACEFSPDGNGVLVGEWHGGLRIYDIGSDELVRRIAHAEPGRDPTFIRVARFSPDGSSIAASAFGIPVAGRPTRAIQTIYHTATGAVERVLTGHGNWITGCAFSQSGDRLATVAEDSTAIIWDTRSGDVLAVLWHPGPVRACMFAPGEAALLTAADDGTLRLWDVEAGIAAARDARHTGPVAAVAVSSDGSAAASVAQEPQARLWDVSSGTSRGTLLLEAWGSACALSPDGSRLATYDGDGTFRLWNVALGTELVSIRDLPSGVRGCGSGNALAFSPDGSRLAVPAERSTPESRRRSQTARDEVAVLDPESGATLARLHGHTNYVLACAWSPDGRRLVTTSADGRVLLWEPPTTAASPLATHTTYIHRCAFSPDGRYLAWAAIDGALGIVDILTRTAVASVQGPDVWWCSFTPESRSLMCVGHDGTMRVLAGPGWTERFVRRAHAGAARMSVVLGDGHRGLTAGDDGWVKLWDLERGEELAAIYRGGHTSLASTADGRVVAVGAEDGTVQFFHVQGE